MTDSEKLLKLLDQMPSPDMASALAYQPDPGEYDFVRGVAEWVASNGETDLEMEKYVLDEFDAKLRDMQSRADAIAKTLGNQSGDGKYADDLRLLIHTIRGAVDVASDNLPDSAAVLEELRET